MSHLSDVRHAFLDYFEKREHTLRSSASLLPENDPTLLFVNAGMVPFKKNFTNSLEEVRNFTSVQKCLRVGGKHNDLEHVGHTKRHHTFFEMLGNFSFGGYFKEEAIKMAWDFLIKVLQIDSKRLWITVHASDKVSGELWKKIANVSPNRILTVDTDDNFWSMGERGPCGPCSEIYYDLGDHFPGKILKGQAPEGDRYLEIWNLVFTQYDRQRDGTLKNLPHPCIDTGMGLERIATVLEGVDDNYSLPEFQQLMNVYKECLPSDGAYRLACRVMADHLRAIAFLMADGVHPSREGRGYVLRRIIRRAVRYGHKAGSHGPILTKPLTQLLAIMGTPYPELFNAEPMIRKIVMEEEQRFLETLDRGLKVLKEETITMKTGATLSGEVLFRLYDTYGFPVDLTQDLLHEQSLLGDIKGFHQCMEEQKKRGKHSWKTTPIQDNRNLLNKLPKTLFKGYETLSCEGKILAIISHKKHHDFLTLEREQSCLLVFDQTPFYAESGGQIADQGLLTLPSGEEISIKDVQNNDGVFVHDLCLETFTPVTLHQGAKVTLSVSPQRRLRLQANHSATHLLHEALRHVLGKHVVQRGSLVTQQSLRFDFSHSAPLAKEEKEKIEMRINKMIIINHPSQTRVMAKKDAFSSGAIYMMGENYGETIRVVSLGEKNQESYSMEFCGGTHVKRTGDIGLFIITKEINVASGVRRIEALTGVEALKFTQKKRHLLREASMLLKVAQDDLPERLREWLSKLKKTQQDNTSSNKNIPFNAITKERCGSYDLSMGQLNSLNGKELRQTVRRYQKDHKGVFVLFSQDKDRIFVVISFPEGLSTLWNAKILLDEINPIIDAHGGGNATLAQSGGRNPGALKKAQEKLRMLLMSEF